MSQQLLRTERDFPLRRRTGMAFLVRGAPKPQRSEESSTSTNNGEDQEERREPHGFSIAPPRTECRIARGSRYPDLDLSTASVILRQDPTELDPRDRHVGAA